MAKDSSGARLTQNLHLPKLLLIPVLILALALTINSSPDMTSRILQFFRLSSSSSTQNKMPSTAARAPVFKNLGAPGVDEYYPLNEPTLGTPYSKDEYPQNKDIPKLFDPITIRDVTFKNRIWVSPMCQYSAVDGQMTDWHLVHLGGFAIRGAGSIMFEASAVTPEGRITPEDAGIWSDSHIPQMKRIVDFIHGQGTMVGIQLAHAGRKASTLAPWVQDRRTKAGGVGSESSIAREEEGGWEENVIAPSEIPFSATYPKPRAMTEQEIDGIAQSFVDAVERCKKIGFDFIEIHGAHGYLIHSFYSPLSNNRTDEYGGSLENRLRLPLRIARTVREAWGPSKPLFFRVSATDWAEGPEKDEKTGEWRSWGIEQTVILAKELKKIGVDLIDTSSGGNWVKQKIPIGPGYQVPFAERVKKDVPDVVVGSVGLITSPQQAEQILQDGQADVVFLARELLRHADFPIYAAQELGVVVKPANHTFELESVTGIPVPEVPQQRDPGGTPFKELHRWNPGINLRATVSLPEPPPSGPSQRNCINMTIPSTPCRISSPDGDQEFLTALGRGDDTPILIMPNTLIENDQLWSVENQTAGRIAFLHRESKLYIGLPGGEPAVGQTLLLSKKPIFFTPEQTDQPNVYR
ncbi:NADH:flavin oxidoreductase/NADH oxidase [Ceratobasidium sp. AG-Ba]|nr:NADH:flavin oxidoreductase/NADH oxidase [Ceratobasidium sp. AG-Ba]QRW06826.1 NADH:flavin oxidoreductase/NADH oxidase [Ceratobasidium sp. AG-Ba]